MSSTANFEDLEAWAKMGVLGMDVQVYDLMQVTDFVAELADAAKEADAPLFSAGLVPAEKCAILLRGFDNPNDFIPLYLERAGTDGIRCSMLSIRAHNLVMTQMRESAGQVAEMLASGGIPKHLQPAIDWLDRNDWLDPGLPQNQLYPEPLFRIGAPLAGGVEQGHKALGRMASAACEFMAMPIAARSPGALPRPMRRRLDRLGKGVRITNVNVTRAVAAGLARGVGTGDAGRALHFVSGHWRASPTSIHAQPVHGQMKIWIDGFWRGDPEHGVVLHRYLARGKPRSPALPGPPPEAPQGTGHQPQP
jgi:hypothetical protein